MTPNGATHPVGSGPACPPCIAAETNPFVGEYRNGCFHCQVRLLSHQPAAARSAFYTSLPSNERRVEFQMAVAAEYRRRKALLADRNVQ